MILFESYIDPNTPSIVYCDITGELDICQPPPSRVLCGPMIINCGAGGCSGLIVSNGFILCDCSQSWNCNLCGNDSPFWIPVQSGDTYTFQFQQPNHLIPIDDVNDGWTTSGTLDSLFGMAYFEIRQCCNDEIVPFDTWETFVANQYVGTFDVTQYNGDIVENQIQQIEFNLGVIAEYMISLGLEPCFYFNFCFSTSDQYINDELEGGNKICFCSEPFKYEPCPTEKRSVLISSHYSSTDCFGLYFGTNYTAQGGTAFPYSNEIRVPAYFEQNAFNISKSIIETSRKTTGSEVCESWTLKTFPLPQSFMKLMVSIIAGRDVFVDYLDVNFQGELSKNNDTGSRWWADVKFEHCECSRNLSCK